MSVGGFDVQDAARKIAAAIESHGKSIEKAAATLAEALKK